MKTKRQIVEETVQFYSEDPLNRRGMNKHGHCCYLSEDGRQCAVGRCLQGDRDVLLNAPGDIQSVLWQKGVSFKEEYKGHHLSFWYALQRLHDNNGFWTKTGLSPEGQAFIKDFLTFTD